MNTSSTRIILALNLRIIRALRKLSQEAMADLVGMDRSYFGGIERAERNLTLDALERIAQALGVSITSLLTEPDPEQVARRIFEAANKADDGVPRRIREEPALYAVA